jgi:hypothetical protein
MKATTFRIFQESIANEWKANGYEFDAYDLNASATPQRWHEEALIPHAEAGGTFGFPTLQSIAGDGAWHGLAWYAKHYPNSIPAHCEIQTGRAISKKDLTATNPNQ